MRKFLPILGFLYPLAVYLLDRKLNAHALAHPAITKIALLIPVLYSVGGLALFARSLKHGPTIVAQIARTIHRDLSPQEEAHCRQATQAWCVFFILNIAITVGLALGATVFWWALYTNVISYIVIGAMIVIEHIVRWQRFPHRQPAWVRRCFST